MTEKKITNLKELKEYFNLNILYEQKEGCSGKEHLYLTKEEVKKGIEKLEQSRRNEINRIKKEYFHVLEGELSTISENAPRSLMQLSAETQLKVLYNSLGEIYKSKLKKYINLN